MPSRYRTPAELEEAMLISEIGFPPAIIDEMPEALIDRILIYKGVKTVTEYGGNWQP